MVDKIKLKVAKAQANYRIHLEELQQAELILSISDPNNLTAWQLTGSASFVGAYWSGNRIDRMIIKDEDDGEAVLTPPRSQVPPVPPNIHPELEVEILMHRLSTIVLEFSTNAKDTKQEITLVFRLATHPDQNKLLKADCILPADRTSATLMSFVAPLVTNELLDHLLENALHYSQAIWMDADPGTLAMQLSEYQFKGKRLIEYIDPSPLSTAGNFLVFRWKDEDSPEWQEWKEANVDQSKVGVDLVSLPTGGVFAEAVLGRFNSAEKLDITRFWNWQDSPIPIQAPEIAAIQAGQHQISGAPQTGSLEAPIINIQTPQSLPDPTGMSSIISALTTANMFRDMSGAAQTAALAQAALQSASQGANSAMTQAGANMATAGQFQVEMTKALLPLIGAAMGIPVPPSPGTSNITNAGAAINHGAKMDAKSFDGAGSNGVSGGDSSSGGSDTGSPSGNIDGGSGNPPSTIFASNRGGFEAEAFRSTIPATNVIAVSSGRGSGGLGSHLLQTAIEKGQGAALSLADAIGTWNSDPDANLSTAMQKSLLKFAEDDLKKSAANLLTLIPLGKAMQAAVKLSVAFAEGIGEELRRTNERLRREYDQTIRNINLDDDGLSEEEIERMRFLSSYQLTAIRELKPIVKNGLERMTGQAILLGVDAAKKVFDDNLKTLVISLARNDEFFSLISSLVEETRSSAAASRRSVEEGIMAFMVKAFIKQLPKSDFKTSLSNLIKPVKGDQPIVMELLAGTVKVILDLEADSLKNQLGKAFPEVRQMVLDTAKELHIQFKTDGSLQLIPGPLTTVEIDQKKLTVPQSIITELEAAVAADKPISFEELSVTNAFFDVQQIQNDMLRVKAAELMNRVNRGGNLDQMDSINMDITVNAMQLVEKAWQSLRRFILTVRPELIDQAKLDAFIREKLLVDNKLTYYRLDKMRIGSNDLDFLQQIERTDIFLIVPGIEP